MNGERDPRDNPRGAGTAAPPPPHRPRGRLIIQSTVVMLAVTACCLFAGLIASRYPAYADLTSTRAHRLSPRTMDTLSRLTGPTEMVVTVNSAGIDARSAERTRDVLDALDRASDRLSVTVVDVASASGAAELQSVWSRIGERHRAAIAAQQQAIERSASFSTELALRLERLAGLLAEAGAGLGETGQNGPALKRFLEDSAAFGRLGGKDVSESVARCGELLRTNIGSSPVPSFDTAATALRRPLPTIGAQLSEISRSLEAAARAPDEQLSAATRDRLKPLIGEVGGVRDWVGRVEESLGALARMPLVTVARALERSSTALVIGPPTEAGEKSAGRELAAVEIEALFPPDVGADGSQVRMDLRARTEEVLGSALATLVNPAPPIVVLVHGEDRRFAPDFAMFQQVLERLRLRGMDIVEWPVWLDKELPSLARLNPRGERPVVFATIYTVPETPQDAARYVNLTRTVSQLVSEGKPVLMSVNPSTMPAIGQSDAMVDFLEPLGLKVDSGRPLFHQVGTPAAPVVSPDTFVIPTGGEHAIAGAVRGQRLRLPWATPIRVQGNAPGVTPLVSVERTDRTWGESQWLDFRAVPGPQRAMIPAERQPKPDSQRDDTAPEGGRWIVAAAVEYRPAADAEGAGGARRLVVVGSNGWFVDEVAEAAALIDNRRVAVNPGNSELLEASVYWLARQEQAIGTSAQTESAPVIPPLRAGTVSAIRWLLIAGLPVMILLSGAAWRLIRG